MGALVIGHDIGLAFGKMNCPAVLEFAGELSFEAVYDMAFLTPVVREIPWGIAYDAYAQSGELVGLPGRFSTGSWMRGCGYLVPVNDLEGNRVFIHR